jgi:hypothetical protein
MPRLVPADQDLGGLHAMAAIAAINNSEIRHLLGQDGNLLQCRRQCMAVVWVAREAAGANETAVKGGGETDLGAELVTDAGLALGDAVDLGLVQGVDLVLALRRLLKQATDQPERFQHLPAQRTFGDVLQMAAQVPVHPANIALELAQGLAHALELSGVGIAPDLGSQIATQGGRSSGADQSRPFSPSSPAARVPARKAAHPSDERWSLPSRSYPQPPASGSCR